MTVILINAGERVLTNASMEEITTQAGAKIWYQMAIPTDLQMERLEQEIARLVAKFMEDNADG
jgi:hypothetical protein